MLNGGGMVHKLIIVCESKMKVHANLLLQLIGSKDDKDDIIVGSKDGSVEATVWEEKEYIANEPKLSSNTNIVFIGDSKSANTFIPNLVYRFDKYGVRLGWRGNRAVIYVEGRMLKKDEYDNFITYCKGKQKELKEKAKVNAINSAHPLVKWTALFVPYVYPAAIYALVFGSVADRKIKQQQYEFGVHNFYMEHLAAFLEE